MRNVVLSLLIFVMTAGQAWAGMSYQFSSVTSGRGDSDVSGKAFMEGKRMRMEVTAGKSLFFTPETVLLSSDGMKTLRVLNTEKRTYFDLSIEETLSMVGNLMKSLGGMVKLEVANPRVEVTDGGEGGVLEGYATRKYVVQSSYTLNMKVMGMKSSQMVSATTESWVTEKIPQENMSFFQLRELKTGMPELDKIIAVESTEIKGFPLKVVRTQTTRNGNKSETATVTTSVTEIRTIKIPDAAFAIPEGYVKRESPVHEALGKLP